MVPGGRRYQAAPQVKGLRHEISNVIEACIPIGTEGEEAFGLRGRIHQISPPSSAHGDGKI